MEGDERDRGDEGEDGIEGEPRQEVTTTSTIKEIEKEGVEIPFHALTGSLTGKIIKVQEQVGERKLLVLIDSGNMHSFLNEATALELRCKITATTLLSMAVANRSKMYSHNNC